jgi:hypothetical protein
MAGPAPLRLGLFSPSLPPRPRTLNGWARILSASLFWGGQRRRRKCDPFKTRD